MTTVGISRRKLCYEITIQGNPRYVASLVGGNCGPVKPYRQPCVLHLEALGIHHSCRVLCPHGNKKQGEDSEGDIVYYYF